ncbi:ankyrin, partial [Bimuria novae-zelandiae CBS 107.79]
YTPLHVAVELNNIALIEALLDTGASIEARVVSNLATLHIAIYRRDVIAVRVLLGRGADIETRALDVDAVKTPLFTAASNSDIECVKLLIEFGADIHATNEVMRTALHEAAEGDSTDLVQFLLN